MIDLKGINFESIRLKVGALVGRVYHKEEHNEKILNIDASQKAVIGTQIAKQIVLNLPEGLPQSDQAKLLKAALGSEETLIEQIPPEASGDAVLPAHTTNSPIEDFLKKHHEEYLKDKNLLLDRGGLLYVYTGREDISFSEDELVFLTQASLKNDFPIWFWLFNYRERFGNVVPLLQKAFRHSAVKIRRGVISSLNDFSDTTDEVVTLMQSEQNPQLLGYAVSKFLEKKDTERAQQIVANALTRKIIPVLTKKGQEKASAIKLELGPAEKRILHNEIENGWQSDKLKALIILSLSAEEADLASLEKLLTKTTYTNITNLVLACIKRIGKTSKAEYILKEIGETRWQESFLSHVEALVGIKYKAIFPKLLEWLSDSSKVTSRFWMDAKDREIDEALQDAVSDLLDTETYEILVNYILKRYSPDRYGNIMSWRHFRALLKQKDNPEIVPLLKLETRLSEFKEWAGIVAELELKQKITQTDVADLLASVKTRKSKEAFLVLRKLYSILSPEQAFKEVSPLIAKIREDLVTRLAEIAAGDHPEEVKELAKNDLEKFLGENRMFYRLHRKKKKYSRSEIAGEEDTEFEELSKDIENFSTLEKEYFAHIFKSKSADIRTFLLSSIGRPYENIYECIAKDDSDAEQLAEKLKQLLGEQENPLISLKAIDALVRLKKGNAALLRAAVISILVEARDNVKASRGMVENSEDWFVAEITYLWALDSLIEFALPEDFTYIREAANREKLFARNYHRYSYFFGYEVMNELLNLSENLEDPEERENAFSALNTLDYNWTKEVLGVEP